MFETEGQVEETQVTETESSDASPGASTEQPGESVLDLDSVQKFRFEGREWSPKDFRQAHMMHADYTRKTQQLAEERKYYDNLQDDLERVKANPQLAEKFRSIYPEKFHKFLGYVSPAQAASAAQGQNQGSTQGQAPTDPALMSRIEAIEKQYRDQQAAAIDAELEAKFGTLSKKYPLADEESVIARAEALLSRAKETGDKDFKLTDATWDRLWKADQERHEGRYKSHYSKQIQKQSAFNQKGKDAASGGGVPGQAPKQFRSIKDASAAALADMEAS